MLFNSLEFVCLFLPATIFLFFISGRFGGPRLAKITLSLASCFFYAWWNPIYLLLILAEVVFCYVVGRYLLTAHSGEQRRKLVASLAVAAILLVLGYFKYTNFLIGTLNDLSGTSFYIGAIVLPLGISFHSFQQIAYIVDCYAHRARPCSFLDYCLFVTFFPQLIAGPIVHHHEMLPQLARPQIFRPRFINILIGLTIFSIGLFKKTVIADGLAQLATPIFTAAQHGTDLTFVEAWSGALAYTLQIYFDFSGYSDMAIGLARFFNIRLPANFLSPYKSLSIAEFWRRWHMTLSRFLRDYVYIPLGGNRRGAAKQTANLMITMLLGGLWHGAAWTFVVWGGLHGLYLVIHRVWSHGPGRRFQNLFGWKYASWFLTMLCVMVGWVFFRSADFSTAAVMLRAMFAPNLNVAFDVPNFENVLGDGWWQIGFALFVALALPNTVQLFNRYRPALLPSFLRRADQVPPLRLLSWRPQLRWAIASAALFGLAFLAIFGWRSEFLYFQF